MQNRAAEIMTRKPIRLSITDSDLNEEIDDFEDLYVHRFMEILLCEKGSGFIDDLSGMTNVEEDAFVLVPPGLKHKFFTVPDSQKLQESLYIDLDDMSRFIFPDAPLKQKNISILSKQSCKIIPVYQVPALVEVYELIIREFKDNEANYQNENLLALTTVLLINLYRAYKDVRKEPVQKPDYQNGSNQLQQAIDYMNRNYSDDMKIGYLASMCHVSESHFRRMFVAKMGKTPVEYINCQRVREACRLISQDKYTMEEVARRCGFGNASTFYRNFKRIMGESPLKWQKNN